MDVEVDGPETAVLVRFAELPSTGSGDPWLARDRRLDGIRVTMRLHGRPDASSSPGVPAAM